MKYYTRHLFKTARETSVKICSRVKVVGAGEWERPALHGPRGCSISNHWAELVTEERRSAGPCAGPSALLTGAGGNQCPALWQSPGDGHYLSSWWHFRGMGPGPRNRRVTLLHQRQWAIATFLLLSSHVFIAFCGFIELVLFSFTIILYWKLPREISIL